MNTNNFIRTYINTKVTGDFIDSEMEPMDALKSATENNQLKKLDDDIRYCCYKTHFKDEDAIFMVFSMEVVGPSGGSSKCSDKIMNLVYALNQILKTTDFMFYDKKPIKGERRKHVVLLKIIKVIKEDDLL